MFLNFILFFFFLNVNIIIPVWRSFSRPLAKVTAFPEILKSAGALPHASMRSVLEENDDGSENNSE